MKYYRCSLCLICQSEGVCESFQREERERKRGLRGMRGKKRGKRKILKLRDVAKRFLKFEVGIEENIYVVRLLAPCWNSFGDLWSEDSL